jgi:hypothetical protein
MPVKAEFLAFLNFNPPLIRPIFDGEPTGELFILSNPETYARNET